MSFIYYRIINRLKTGDNKKISNFLHYLEEDRDKAEKDNTLVKAHTFWIGDIGSKQLLCLKSFVCTQDMTKIELILWMGDEDSYTKAINNTSLISLFRNYENVSIRLWDLQKEITNTSFEKIAWYFKWERPLPYVADDFRIIALNKYGGLYFDMDIMFVKDFQPLLLGHEFVYAWETQPFANNALIYLRKGSFLNHQISRRMLKKKSSQPWVVFNYNYKRIQTLMIYPCSLFDPLWMGYKQGMPIKSFADFFRKFDSDFRKDPQVRSYKDFFPGIYAYHWHNCWNMSEYDDSYFGLFSREFDMIINSKC